MLLGLKIVLSWELFHSFFSFPCVCNLGFVEMFQFQEDRCVNVLFQVRLILHTNHFDVLHIFQFNLGALCFHFS